MAVAGVLQVPWYATGFRGDDLEAAVSQIAPIALRYGARDYAVYRSHEDRYRILQMATFETKREFEAYWFGDEFTEMRAACSSWYQVPLVYGWSDLLVSGALDEPQTSVIGEPDAVGDTAT
jgi:hypothetical protein